MKVQSAMFYFPEEVIEHIFSFLTSHHDRNTVSTVCKAWNKIERLSRREVFVGNCYAVKPERAAALFPGLRVLTLKGKPHFADFDLVPPGWGASAGPWIEAMARSCPNLEELRMKRMVVSDESLELLAHCFPNFKVLVLVSCEGFSTDGLAAVARSCKSLRELDLQENEIEDRGPRWLNSFLDSCTSLVSLNFACLKEEVNVKSLERLVCRSPNLKSLRLNRAVLVETLAKIISQCPNLEDLGTGALIADHFSEAYISLAGALQKCKKLKSLSGFWDVSPLCLLALYPVCCNLTGLNLSYAPTVQGQDFVNLIQHCVKLQRLWVLDSVGDKGLAVVASACKELHELRVFPSDPFAGVPATVTEEGLVAISAGCPKLNSLLYFCHSMTNSALITVSKNCPNFTRFRLCILEPRKPDPVTNEPLDEGFGAVVKTCKNLRRFSISGLLTDQVFYYIGKYAQALEMLSIAFAGDGDQGMMYILNGCKNLRKLEIRDCPFGDAALLADVTKYETMRSLWMSSCDVSLRGCKALAAKMRGLNVELIYERDAEMEENHNNGVADVITNGNNKSLNNGYGNDERKVEKLYVYRTVGGPRSDAPDFVSIL